MQGRTRRGGTHHFRLPAAWGYSHPFTVLPMPWDEPFDRPAVRDAAVDAVGELCTPRDVLTRGQPVTELSMTIGCSGFRPSTSMPKIGRVELARY